MTDQQILDANIIVELGLDYLPDDQKVQLIQSIATLVQKSAMLKIIDLLSDDDKQTLDGLIQDKGPQSSEVIDFLQTLIPTIGDILQEELIKVKRDLIMQVRGVHA